MTERIRLRPHQEEAVEAIVRGLVIPPGTKGPVEGLRGTVVSACGTGKTFIGAAAAKRLVPEGRVLVLAPTLELLAQTVREWQAIGHHGSAVAVCSLADDPRLHSLGVRCTTSARQLVAWHRAGPVTAYATYASLPVLIEAHRNERAPQMSTWDLILIDEAHRTSGSWAKAWTAVHDQQMLPSRRRLYMTATPRLWQERQVPRLRREDVAAANAPTERKAPMADLVCSMDDEAIYGPLLYELDLPEAIARGLLARYQIVVVELRDDRLTPARLCGEERLEESVRGERLAVLQAALLETMAAHGLTRCITFHHRTIEAQAFTEGLNRAVRRLHAEDPERHPERVWSSWLSGEHQPCVRADRLIRFGRYPGRAVLSNCRVLGEGVDVPAVDSVALIDPRGSAVDIVQAIGRALRQKPHQGKLATLIVPVFLEPGEKAEDMPYSPSYQPLVKVLSGLRAHDERAVEMLAGPQRTEASPTSTYPTEQPGHGEEARLALLRFGTHRDPALIAKFVRYNLVEPERASWKAGHQAAAAYRQRTGHLRMPYGHRELLPNGHSFPLGRWLADQRRALQAGGLTGQRAADLDELGMVWDPSEVGWEDNLAAARAYFAQTGTLAAPVTATILDKPVGQWLANCRKQGGLGKNPERAAQRATQLAEIDPDWRPGWPVDWQRSYAGVTRLLALGTSLGEIVDGVTVDSVNVGRWLERQRQQVVWQGLSAGQRERLTILGLTPRPAPPESPVKKLRGGPAAFERGCAALRQFRARTGTVRVPRSHVERLNDGTEIRLGVFLSNTKIRHRQEKLSTAQRQTLAALGLTWAT
ncbi:Helicase conserved C-terminal domain-containing protein [Streptomyces sp. 2231.1]|uniref:DEAD/DEAH box helicase n=1 Tax=Streptomyces sp. 2231.1 TaxID=1855347 RepID=UPI000896FAF5|nr:DEAD/DEAH box helicase [Streptomyces sp. 2231.1]SEC00095.1 Helicase conserved C-terminal domain-containing protein [Streptomyces sp. 2231.1]